MPKTYHQHCGLARALDVVGERWTLLLVRELLLGPRRYKQLLEALEGLTTNLLAERLQRLQADGVIEKHAGAYRLTEAGARLEPVIMELARWGGQFMGQMAPGDRRSLAWALLSLKRRYRGGQRLTVGLDTGARTFELHFAPDGLVVREQPWTAPDITLQGSEDAFFDLLYGSASGQGLSVTGDLSRFLELIPRS